MIKPSTNGLVDSTSTGRSHMVHLLLLIKASCVWAETIRSGPLAYHTINDTWVNAGSIPANHVTTTAVKRGDSIIIPSGEIRPRVRSPKIWMATPQKTVAPFGWLNFITLGVYFIALVGMGIYFSRREKTTNDFFLGGQRVK